MSQETGKSANEGPEQPRLWSEREQEKLRDSSTSPTPKNAAPLSFEVDKGRKAHRQGDKDQHVAKIDDTLQQRLPGLE